MSDVEIDGLQKLVSDYVRENKSLSYYELRDHLREMKVSEDDIKELLIDDIMDSPYSCSEPSVTRPVTIRRRTLRYDRDITVIEREMPGILGLMTPQPSSGLIPSTQGVHYCIKPSPKNVIRTVSREYYFRPDGL